MTSLRRYRKVGTNGPNGTEKSCTTQKGQGSRPQVFLLFFRNQMVVSRHGDNIQGWIKMLHNSPWRLEIERLDEA